MANESIITFEWIETLNINDMREAVRIIEDVLAQIDRCKDPIVIPGRAPTVGGFRAPPSQHKQLIRWREEVMLMLLKRGVFKTARYLDGGYRDEHFVVEADEAVVRKANELFTARSNGRLTLEMLASAAMTVQRPALTWLEEIPRDVLEEVVSILENIDREFQLGGQSPVKISPFPGDTHGVPIGQDQALASERSKIAELLYRRGIIGSHHTQYVGGSLYIADQDRGDWLFIEADHETVRDALAQAREQVRRREQYEGLPRNKRDALPIPKWAAKPAGPITNYYGPVSQVTSTGDYNTITVTVGAADISALLELVVGLRAAIDKLGLNSETKAEIEAEIATIEAQAKSPKPKPGILMESLKALAIGMASVAGNALAQPIIHQIQVLLSHFIH